MASAWDNAFQNFGKNLSIPLGAGPSYSSVGPTNVWVEHPGYTVNLGPGGADNKLILILLAGVLVFVILARTKS